jgi:hypothetical protein
MWAIYDDFIFLLLACGAALMFSSPTRMRLKRTRLAAGLAQKDRASTPDRINLHAGITIERAWATLEADSIGLHHTGFCLICGCEQKVEAARSHSLKCQNCTADAVISVEELLHNYVGDLLSRVR